MPASPVAHEELEAGLRALTAESGGAVAVYVIRPEDGPDLIRAAAAGDELANTLLRALERIIHAAYRSPARSPTICATCDKSIRRKPFSAVIVLALADHRTQALGLGICPHCATTVPELAAKAQRALREIWPDCRPIPPVTHPEGGRA
jgi:hypothetical protein